MLQNLVRALKCFESSYCCIRLFLRTRKCRLKLSYKNGAHHGHIFREAAKPCINFISKDATTATRSSKWWNQNGSKMVRNNGVASWTFMYLDNVNIHYQTSSVATTLALVTVASINVRECYYSHYNSTSVTHNDSTCIFHDFIAYIANLTRSQ